MKGGGLTLEGKVVLVTRPRKQSAELLGRLGSAGARVVGLPAIRIRPPADPRPLARAARRYLEGDYDRVVFTSPNGVEAFFKALRRSTRTDGRAARAARFAAIGPKTAEALRRRGARVSGWPAEHRGEALAKSMKVRRGERVLLPRAAKAREVLPRMLRKAGARVDVVEAYRTEPDREASAAIRRVLSGSRPPDWITFTSSSTVESLRGLFGAAEWRAVFRRCRAASIGPVTSATLRRLGVRPAAEARPYTARGLARAIVAAESKR